MDYEYYHWNQRMFSLFFFSFRKTMPEPLFMWKQWVYVTFNYRENLKNLLTTLLYCQGILILKSVIVFLEKECFLFFGKMFFFFLENEFLFYFGERMFFLFLEKEFLFFFGEKNCSFSAEEFFMEKDVFWRKNVFFFWKNVFFFFRERIFILFWKKIFYSFSAEEFFLEKEFFWGNNFYSF